ncbi:MAG TPA: STAS domain-containing protein [Rubrobacter sp.]
MYGIEVRESGVGLVVELWGEFDIFCVAELKRMLVEVSSRRRPTLVDLSGIAFLDLQSAREIAVRSLLYAHHLTFRNPSPQVMATVGALGLEGWLNLLPDTGRDEPQVFSGVS